MLPFGLRSAQKTFTAVADALEWFIRVVDVAHYLGDHIVIGQIAVSVTWTSLGVPLVPEKRDSPTARIVFLGIIIDSQKGFQKTNWSDDWSGKCVSG